MKQVTPECAALLPGFALTIFPCVKYSEYEDVSFGDFVANLIIAHENLAYVARTKLGQARTKARVGGDLLRT